MSSQPDQLQDVQDDVARSVMERLPERWGRMDMMSRTTLVEVGRLLEEEGLLAGHPPKLAEGWTGGLIVGTSRGSLAVDVEYAATVKDGPGMASPHLFSYTLPNIPLAEAAIQYSLTGPVFCVVSSSPYEEALQIACQWLDTMAGKHQIMVAGALDVKRRGESSEITAHFKVLRV